MRRSPNGGCRLLAIAAAAVAAASCGTAVFHHRIEVRISDPSGRLGPPPHQVSVFDRYMGYSVDWSTRFQGSTSPSAPYVGEIGGTATRMFWDSSLPPEVVANVSVPAYNPEGSFLLILAPRHGQTRTVDARFVEFDAFFPAEGADTLTADYTSAAESDGWRIQVSLEIPPP